MTTLKEALQDCLHELRCNDPDEMHDHYKCQLDGILPMCRRYGTTDAQDDAAHAVYMAYSAADEVRELLDFHFDEAYTEDEAGNLNATPKLEALWQAFIAARNEAERLVDALDEAEAASEEDEAADEDDD